MLSGLEEGKSYDCSQVVPVDDLSNFLGSLGMESQLFSCLKEQDFYPRLGVPQQ